MITKARLASMKEKELQREVLKPLFEALGFRDVEVHQGNTEIGKDLVMWKYGDVGERLNYAVVVKAKAITGKAAGASSAAEVRFQIEQALSSEWPDSKTTQLQRADRCWIVCSKQIKKEARAAIQGVLKSNNLDRVTRFIDGDELWRLVQEHNPEKTVFGKLKELDTILDAASPDYKLVAKTTGELTIEPRSAQKLPEDPLFRITVDFPKTKEGKVAKERIDKQLSFGEPVVIESAYLTNIEMADFLVPIVGPVNLDQAKLVLQPVEIAPVDLDVSIESREGAKTTLGFELKGSRGSTVLRLHNQGQNVPYKIRLVVSLIEKKIDLSFSIEAGIHNVKPKLDALRFWNALAAGGTLRMTHRQTGVVIIEQQVAAGKIPFQDLILLEVFEKLTTIQMKTKQLINAPGELSGAAIELIFSTFVKVDKGAGVYRGDKITFPANIELASNLLKYLGDGQIGNLFYKTNVEQTVKLFDTEINLGHAVLLMDKVSLDPREAGRIESKLASAPSDATIDFPLTIENEFIRVWYPKWLPEEQRLALPVLDEGDLGSV